MLRRTSASYFVGVEVLADRFNDAVRCAPQLVRSDAVERDRPRIRPARQLPLLDRVSFGADQVLQRHLENFFDLGLLAAPGRRWAVQATEKWRDPEASRRCLDQRQRRQDLDAGGVQSDFFVRLAQGCSQQVGVLGLATAARKRDLPTVDPMWTAAD